MGLSPCRVKANGGTARAHLSSRLVSPPTQVIILSAALDLVSTSTPKGLVAFFNIFPALIAKVGWPYLLKGRIRYRRRICACAALSFTGMLVRPVKSASVCLTSSLS